MAGSLSPRHGNCNTELLYARRIDASLTPAAKDPLSFFKYSASISQRSMRVYDRRHPRGGMCARVFSYYAANKYIRVYLLYGASKSTTVIKHGLANEFFAPRVWRMMNHGLVGAALSPVSTVPHGLASVTKHPRFTLCVTACTIGRAKLFT